LILYNNGNNKLQCKHRDTINHQQSDKVKYAPQKCWGAVMAPNGPDLHGCQIRQVPPQKILPIFTICYINVLKILEIMNILMLSRFFVQDYK
jgi:hypothetical protein